MSEYPMDYRPTSRRLCPRCSVNRFWMEPMGFATLPNIKENRLPRVLRQERDPHSKAGGLCPRGEHLNDHGVERGHGTLWHINLRVPLLMRFPKRIEPGTTVAELTRQIDVLPTILDYCGLPMP